MRHAFGLPQVLLIILFIGGIVSVTMRYATLGAKHYTDSYTHEQAELFMQSVTEATLLKIGAYDRSINKDCLQSIPIDSRDGRFHADVNISTYYLFEGKDNDGSALPNCDRVVSIQSEESHGMIDMTVVVTSQDPKLTPVLKLGNKVRLERRSLQRL